MTDYNKLKVPELKDLLKDRGIPSTGLTRKAQIVEALEGHDAKVSDESAPDVVAQQEDEDEYEDEDEDEGGEGDMPIEEENAGDAVVENEQNTAGEPADEAGDLLSGTNDTSVVTNGNPTTDPTVEEERAPLGATPERESSPAERLSSETRKRKRRSPTPPPSEGTINKKLKSAEEMVKLPEDEVVDDAPIPVDAASSDAVERETVLPNSTSDDVMEDAPPLTSELDATPQTQKSPAMRSPNETYAEVKAEHEAETKPQQREPPMSEDDEVSVPAAIHPATRSLYIRDLVRPLQPQPLRDHLVDLATPPKSSPDFSVIDTFHLDTLRTHAFVSFTSTSAASRARSALHGRVWPDEPSRKPLWVDFIPDEKVHEWIDIEMKAGTGKRDAKRWEVIYDTTASNDITATITEIPSTTAPPTARQPSFSGNGQGMPNAPLGPRGSRPSTSAHLPPSSAPTGPRNPYGNPSRPASTPKPSSSASFTVLDERFPFTTAKPKLYYLPVDKDLAAKRLDELQAQTSRTWDEGRVMRKGVSAVDAQLRRYTFEDGDRVVDNGGDIGSFSGPSGGGGYRGGYRGRGGGGGYRGDGGGYRGDGGGYRGRR
ncbi:hypothetical protein LTR37_005316 [Vermiconidia calcicola]|uniref:Uncharacterized protein n=1 Tax=Vermiconidia calcicola TaxID=1690605 RepID=A0ACC3NLE6_9PEZI|nr:hypothetical protein LTR37_005316 [Vermiconidia calcicola]